MYFKTFNGYDTFIDAMYIVVKVGHYLLFILSSPKIIKLDHFKNTKFLLTFT